MRMGQHSLGKPHQVLRNRQGHAGAVTKCSHQIDRTVEEARMIAAKEQHQLLVEMDRKRTRTQDAHREVRRAMLETEPERPIAVMHDAPHFGLACREDSTASAVRADSVAKAALANAVGSTGKGLRNWNAPYLNACAPSGVKNASAKRTRRPSSSRRLAAKETSTMVRATSIEGTGRTRCALRRLLRTASSALDFFARPCRVLECWRRS